MLKAMFDVDGIVHSGGLLLIALIIFAESGLLIGFFLPGDTLLFAAGLAASQGELSIYTLIFVVFVAAVVGDSVGYDIGRRTGKKIFNKKDGILFRQEYLEKAQLFYDKHGGKTIVIARFTPIVRTFAPVVAGASEMRYSKFLFYNIIGGLLWAVSVPLAGYWLGNRFPGLDKYMEGIIFVVVVGSIGLSVVHVLKDKETRKKIHAKVKSKVSRKKAKETTPAE